MQAMNRQERRAQARAAKVKPAKRRACSLDTMSLATKQAIALTPGEVAAVVDPSRKALAAMRQGTSVADDYSLLAGVLTASIGIERKGVVKGFSDVIFAASDALKAIVERAMATGEWKPPTLYAKEITAVDDLLHWHEFQLKQLSYAEYHAALRSVHEELKRGGVQVDVKGICE